ncbi:MAG: acetylglutamate kinase [Candidatus Eisenbacteria bacterium]
MGRKLTVTKVGGAGLANESFLATLVRNTESIIERGDASLIVHGGGPDIAGLHGRLGLEFEVIEGLRVTNAESLDIVVMALCGLLNKRIVARLQNAGLRAVGVSGIDAGILRASYLDRSRFGEVGDAPEVQPGFLFRLIDQDYVPIVAPVAIGPGGTPVNVNADVAAQAIAIALDATELDFVTSEPGVVRDNRVIRSLTPDETESLIQEGTVRGGMIPKVRAARAALESGIRRVRVGNLDTLASGTATEAVLI